MSRYIITVQGNWVAGAFGWYVYRVRRGSTMRTARDIVGGPCRTREDARTLATDLRCRTCMQHEDCRASWDLGRECLIARNAWMKKQHEELLAEIAAGEAEDADRENAA